MATNAHHSGPPRWPDYNQPTGAVLIVFKPGYNALPLNQCSSGSGLGRKKVGLR